MSNMNFERKERKEKNKKIAPIIVYHEKTNKRCVWRKMMLWGIQ
jgi:hypothetical protein